MTNNNIDLSLKIFNSDLKFIVNDSEVKIVLNKDLKVQLDFNTLENTIILRESINNVDEVIEDVEEETEDNTYIEDNTYVEEEQKSDVSLVRPLDTKIEEPNTYWENGILKHKEVSIENEEQEEQEEQGNVSDDISNLPKSAKRGRPAKVVYCPYCGEEVEKDRKFMYNNRLICARCTNKIKEKLKRDILKAKEEE